MQGRPISGFLRELSLPASTLKFFAAARGLRPCRGHAWRAFLLPFGAPGDGPPCIRHRPFGIGEGTGDLSRPRDGHNYRPSFARWKARDCTLASVATRSA